MYRLRHPARKAHRGLDQIFPRNIEWIEDHHGDAKCLGIQGCGDTCRRIVQHNGELIHRDYVVVPRELIRLRSSGPGANVMEVSAHDQRPGIIQALQRIRSRSQPLRRNRGLLRRIGQQLFFSQPALLVSLRSERSRRVIGQLHLPGVVRKPSSLRRRDIEEHLFRSGRDDVDRALTHLDRRPLRVRLVGIEESGRRQTGRSLGDGCFEALHRFLVRRPADVAGTVIVVIGEQPTHFSILLDTRGPIVLVALVGTIFLRPGQRLLFTSQADELLNLLLVEGLLALLHLLQSSLQLTDPFLKISKCRVRRYRSQRLAEVGFDPTAVTTRVQAGQHALAIRPDPYADVERSAHRRFLSRVRPPCTGRGTPHQLLRGESLHARMGQDRRQRSRKSEAIRQHVFRAGLAEFPSEPFISVKDLANDRLRAGSVHIALFHRRSRREPSSRIHVLLQLGEIFRVILLHEPIAVRPAEIENVMGILLEQLEVLLHRLADVFVDDLGVFPSPLGVQMGIADDVESWLLGEVGFFGCLSEGSVK